MKFSRFAFALLLVGCNNDGHIPRCPGKKLPPPVDALVAPILSASMSVISSNQPRAERLLQELNENHAPAAIEARIALLAYYLGEHPAEELLCRVVDDGPVALSILEAYKKCSPACSAEWPLLHRHMKPVLYDYAIEMIKTGKKC